MHKYCTKCEAYKHETEYNMTSSNTKNGIYKYRRGNCRDCQNKALRQRRKEKGCNQRFPKRDYFYGYNNYVEYYNNVLFKKQFCNKGM